MVLCYLGAAERFGVWEAGFLSGLTPGYSVAGVFGALHPRAAFEFAVKLRSSCPSLTIKVYTFLALKQGNRGFLGPFS